MQNPDQLSMKRIAARSALKKGRISPERYQDILREIETIEKRRQSNKSLMKEAKNKILHEFDPV